MSPLAKALAPPPVAAEWCLPLVREGGIAVLWVGESAEPERVAQVRSGSPRSRSTPRRGLLVLRKLGPTPPGFPRRTGVARSERPLAEPKGSQWMQPAEAASGPTTLDT